MTGKGIKLVYGSQTKRINEEVNSLDMLMKRIKSVFKFEEKDKLILLFNSEKELTCEEDFQMMMKNSENLSSIPKILIFVSQEEIKSEFSTEELENNIFDNFSFVEIQPLEKNKDENNMNTSSNIVETELKYPFIPARIRKYDLFNNEGLKLIEKQNKYDYYDNNENLITNDILKNDDYKINDSNQEAKINDRKNLVKKFVDGIFLKLEKRNLHLSNENYCSKYNLQLSYEKKESSITNNEDCQCKKENSENPDNYFVEKLDNIMTTLNELEDKLNIQLKQMLSSNDISKSQTYFYTQENVYSKSSLTQEDINDFLRINSNSKYENNQKIDRNSSLLRESIIELEYTNNNKIQLEEEVSNSRNLNPHKKNESPSINEKEINVAMTNPQIEFNETCSICSNLITINKFLCCICNDLTICSSCEINHNHPMIKVKSKEFSKEELLYFMITNLKHPEVVTSKSMLKKMKDFSDNLFIKTYKVKMYVYSNSFAIRPDKKFKIPIIICNENKTPIPLKSKIIILSRFNRDLKINPLIVESEIGVRSEFSLECESTCNIGTYEFEIVLFCGNAKIECENLRMKIEVNHDEEEERLNEYFAMYGKIMALPKKEKEMIMYINKKEICLRHPYIIYNVMTKYNWDLDQAYDELTYDNGINQRRL